MFDCGQNSYSKVKSYCTNGNLGVQSLTANTFAAYTTVTTETISVVAGYNFLTLYGGYFKVKQGWFLGLVQTSATIAIDDSGTAKISDYTTTPIIDNTKKRAFYVRGFVSRQTLASGFRQYLKAGSYNLTVIIQSPLVSGVNLRSTVNFTIYEPITGLSVLPVNAQCLSGTPCNLTAVTLTGSHITHEWNLPITNQTTTLKSILHTFTAIGSYEVTVFASNPISNATYTLVINVVNLVTNPVFFSSSLYTFQSASIVGKNAEFLFTVTSGSGYTCRVNYGDGSILNFNDLVVNYNGTVFTHLYNREGSFSVSIYCENLFSNATYLVTHYTQYEILNLKVPLNGAFRNVPFSIQFTISSGSSPSFTMFYNNMQDYGISYDSNSKIGYSSSKSASSSGLFDLNITATNLVSRMSLSQKFEIGSIIRDPVFNVLTTGFADLKFHYGTTLNFKVHMTDGSNVRLQFFFGEESDLQVANTDLTIVGDWNAEYPKSYLHVDPGDYRVYVNISNAFGSFVLSHSISVVSTVNDLIPGLLYNPVVYTALGSTAYFKFSYAGVSKAGSHSSVTFWPGDSYNVSFGPYLIGMDFGLNLTTNSLMYQYETIGTYKAAFLVENMLGSKNFEVTFQIREGVSGLYINFEPVVRAATNFEIQTYLVQGQNVIYTWTFDGVVKTANRIGKFFKI